jgi:hypothetical protein
MLIRLRDLMEADQGWGRAHGRQAYDRLLEAAESRPWERVVRISLAGVARTDAVFPRESVLQVAARLRPKRGLCLLNFADQDLLENWDAAAEQAEQPITVWVEDGGRILGPQPTEGTRAVLEYALTVPETTANECSNKFGMQLANSSNKLRYLHDSGYLLRRERPSGSGGIEHVYFRIL